MAADRCPVAKLLEQQVLNYVRQHLYPAKNKNMYAHIRENFGKKKTKTDDYRKKIQDKSGSNYTTVLLNYD
jgi:hypothetical protein